MALFVDHGQAILFVPMQKLIRLAKTDTFFAVNHVFKPRHMVANSTTQIIFIDPKILVGDNTLQLASRAAVMSHGHCRMTGTGHQLHHLFQRHRSRCVGVALDEASLMGLHLTNHFRLSIDRLGTENKA